MKKKLSMLSLLLALSACSQGGSILLDTLSVDGPDAAADSESAPDVVAAEDASDVSLPDLGLELTFPDVVDETLTQCAPGEGCFLDPCSAHDQCLSGWCVDHMGAGVCTLQCSEECPSGWSCQQVAGTAPDLVFVCVSDHANLCRPCASGDNCKSVGGAEDVCVDYGEEGSFCGGLCTSDNDCPWGFSCQESATVDGIATKQCVADAGVCPCTNRAVELALWTPCEVSNDAGTCKGKRVCMAEGLSQCDALSPTPEVCDGLDNDCNGEVDDLECDDGNECTAGICDPEVGCVHQPLDGTSCDDGDVCTLADNCQAGVCVGSAINCDDNNPCTDDACNPTGGCVYTDNQVDCDDGNPCTVKDTCLAGECSGYQVPCDCQENADCGALEDGDLCNGTLICDKSQVPYQCAVNPDTVVTCEGPESPCLAAVCDPVSGACQEVAANTGMPCQDGNACTLSDLCDAGKCVAGPKANCNDGNPCTTDLCDPQTGCFTEFNALPCNDGNACSTGDVCDDGECVGTATLACDDGNVCTDESCDPAKGCVSVANATVCDDGNACTVTDLCTAGLCKGSGGPDCDDGNVCTTDSCDPALGCVHAANTQPCDDGNACTTGDQCGNGACAGMGLVNCNDSNPCTDDSCDEATGCSHEFNAAPCDDLNSCTTGDVCVAGTCLGKGSLECDDSNPCTKDICLPEGGCQHEAADVACDDGDPCTVNDLCQEGQCVSGAAPDCDDDNVCTDDSCVDGLCVHAANLADCDDGNACTVNDLCAQGKCVAGAPLDCDDDNVCTTDSCSPDSGCKTTFNQLPCDDGDACTPKDLCSGGQCAGTGQLNCNDGNPCTDDACEPETGCTHLDNEEECFDNNVCTTGDQCAQGVCTPADTLDCDDGNPCTDDACDPKIGCVHTANAIGCNDGNACTTGDTCKAGSCLGGAPPDCDDSNPCTTDSCDTEAGCSYALNSAPCDDGKVCTINDKCDGGVCVGGAGLTCNDENPCTDDSCLEGVGCQFVNNTVKCDDDNACTTLDLCSDGTCVGSTPPDCNDSNPCTDDSCDTDIGCVHADNTVACDDGDACTTADTCAGGSCVGGPDKDCNDNNVCTADSCDSDTGCVYTALPCCGNGVKDPGEACDDGNNNDGDGCSADCSVESYVHNNGQGVVWYNNVPTGTMTSDQAKLSCQKTFGTCYLSTGDCAGHGWCQQPNNGKCWGWQSGCSGGAGRVWPYGSSYTTYGNWN